MAAKRHLVLAECFDKKGNIISYSYNSYTKTHPIMAWLAKRNGFSEHKCYLHAEVAAILKAKTKAIHYIRVSRYNTKREPVLAKPCPMCAEFIKMNGIKQVFHT